MTMHVLIREAPRAPSSGNAEERSFDVVFATEAPIARRDARGSYYEVLSMAGMKVATSALPVLDSHARGSLANQIGSASGLRASAGQALASVRLSAASPIADRVAADLSGGQTFGVSTGYRIDEAKEEIRDGKRFLIATKWMVLEISLTPIPADATTGIRNMDTQSDTGGHAGATVTNEPIPIKPRKAAVADRATVNTEIRSIAKVAGLGQDFIDAQIDAGASRKAARAAAFEAMRQRSASAATISNAAIAGGEDYNDPEFRARAMGEALFVRVSPSHKPSEPARQYVGLSIPELARDCVRTRGLSTTGLSSATIVERALQSTSDFPLLLADTVNRTLRQAYESAPAGVRLVGRQTTAKDFRAKHRLQFSTAPTLEPINEHGEFKSGGMAEAQESYAVSTFGKIIGFTRQAMVNDDLGAFTDVTRRMGQAAAAFEAGFLANIVSSNPTMSDGVALFHASHGNLAATPAAITLTSLSNARLAMRGQTGLLGELISVTPKYLLVGPARETEAEQMTALISPIQSQYVNVFQGKLEIVVDPRLSGAWYLVADSAEIDGLEYAYLEGNAGPQITSELGFEVDGVRFRVRLDFGGGFVDWRGWFKNAGA